MKSGALSALLIALAALASARPADAGTASGRVAVSAEITPRVVAVATPALPDPAGPARTSKLADVSLTSSNRLGVTVTASIEPLTTPGGTPVEVRIAVLDQGQGGDAVAATGRSVTFASTSAGTATRGLYLEYVAAEAPPSAPYAGVVRLSISDN